MLAIDSMYLRIQRTWYLQNIQKIQFAQQEKSDYQIHIYTQYINLKLHISVKKTDEKYIHFEFKF